MSGRKARAARKAAEALPVIRHRAGQATYDGNVTDTIVGQFRGPTTYGSVVVCVDAVYDAEADVTVATFAHATPGDVAEASR